MFTSLEQICESAKNLSKPKGIAVVCAENEVVLTAVRQAKNTGAIRPMLFGDRKKLEAMLDKLGEDIAEYDMINCNGAEEAAFWAVQAVKEDKAQLIMKGNIHTSSLMRAVLNKETGIRESKCLTNMCIMEIPRYRKLLTISDGAILIRPTLEQKVDMIRSITAKMHGMGYDKIKVSILAASDEVSEKQSETLDAAILKEMYQKGEFPEYVILDGPLSFDLSVDNEAVKNKGVHSEVAGDADLIIVHDIVVANSVCKGLRIFGGAESAGLVLGAKAPLILTSRGASVQSKYMSIMVAAATVR